MLQRYKLRLGDGTVLAVDLDGLSIWLADRKAMVQPAGTRQWKPLKQFLAQERAAARRAARLQPKPPSTPREALPLVYPRPREEAVPPKPRGASQGQPPESGAPGAEGRADGLPLVPPPPRRREGPDGSRRRRASASLRASVRPRRPDGPSGAPPPPPAAPAPPVAAKAAEPPPIAPAPVEPPPIVSPPASPPVGDPAVGPHVEESVDLSPIERPLDEPPVPEERPIEPPPAERHLAGPLPVARPAVGELSLDPQAVEPTPVSEPAAAASSPADEDVDWMALPDSGDNEPRAGAISWQGPLAAAASGQVRIVRAAPQAAGSPGPASVETRPRPALATVSPAAPPRDRLEWTELEEARQPPGALTASAFGGVLALLKRLGQAFLAAWKAIAREAPPRSSVAPLEAVTPHAAASEPLDARARAATAVATAKGAGGDGVYRPRRSAADGLPVLQLDPDESSLRWLDRVGQAGASEEDLPTLELDLEPFEDERPRPARRRR